MARELRTADKVIDKLGGTAVTARLTGRKPQHVSNWRKAGRLPADTFLIVSKRLEEIGYCAPPNVWGITAPDVAEPEKAAP